MYTGLVSRSAAAKPDFMLARSVFRGSLQEDETAGHEERTQFGIFNLLKSDPEPARACQLASIFAIQQSTFS